MKKFHLISNYFLVLAEKDEVKVASDKTVSKEITAAESGGEPSPATASDAFEDTDSKGGNNSSSTLGTRLTRSRANQGTPGPGDQAGDSPGNIFYLEANPTYF